MKQEIKAVRNDLIAWLKQQSEPVRSAAGQVVGDLNAALIGRPSPTLLGLIAEDVAKLAALSGDVRSRQ